MPISNHSAYVEVIMERLFVLEDEITSKMILESTLSQYEIVFASSLEEAKSILASNSFDMYLLDLNLPDGKSLELLKSNYIKDSDFIFFISSSTDLHHQLMSFQLGADDFIQKPFHPLILKAKLESRLKKSIEAPEPQVWEQGNLKLNEASRLIEIDNPNVNNPKLTKMEFLILAYFIQNKNLVLSRTQIIEHISGNDSSVTERSIDAHISKLRKKLVCFNKSITSVHGFGYKIEEDSFQSFIEA